MPRKTRGTATHTIIATAQALRETTTEAEDRLWHNLRDGRLGGLKFRRQHPYGTYVLDFFCVESQLAVEVDGGVHLEPEQAASDAIRTAYLNDSGVRVLRVRNQEVRSNLVGVLRLILREAKLT